MNKKFAIITIIFIGLFFIIHIDELKTEQTAILQRDQNIGEVVDGREIRQVLTEVHPGELKLFISTYNRRNDSKLYISLLKENTEIISWEVPCSTLTDNSYYPLRIDQQLQEGSYELIIRSDAAGGNGITLWKNVSGGHSGLSIDGKNLKGESLCYYLEYKRNLSADERSRLIVFLVLCILTIAIWLMTQNRKIKPENIFLTLWTLLSILFFTSNTVFNVPDELSHFYRAYAISEGHLTSEYNNELHAAGSNLPLSTEKLEEIRTSWETYNENKTATIEEDKQFIKYSNTAMYHPLSYLPQVAGIWIGRLITDRIIAIAAISRFVNWATITILLYLAIKISPKGKDYFALTACMPMTIFEAASVSLDGMAIALTMLLISMVLRIRDAGSERKLSRPELIALYGIGIWISVYKIIYVVFLILYFLIPAASFGGKKKKAVYAVILCIIVASLNCIWLKESFRILAFSTANSTLMTARLLKHPIEFLLMMTRSFYTNGHIYIEQMIGSVLGRLDVLTTGILILAYEIALVFRLREARTARAKADRNVWIACVSTAILYTILLMISLYIHDTPLDSIAVQGIQGRYFIPVLFLAYFAIAGERMSRSVTSDQTEIIRTSSQNLIVLTNICACASLLFSRFS